MKKRSGLFLIIFTLLAVVCGATALVGCKDEKNPVTPSDDKETVQVTLVSLIDGPTNFECKVGAALPVITVAGKDFEGYWTDATYATKYSGTTVPSSDLTLYYRQNAQNYTLVLDYGLYGSISFSLVVGDKVTLPATAPSGTVTAGYSDEKNGEIKYQVGETVLFADAQKDGTVTLFAKYEVSDISDYVIENGVLVGYNGAGTTLSLPLSATRIAAGAFKDNKKIVSVTVPASYTSIGKGAFEGCENLENLTLPFVGQSRTDNRFLAYIFGADKYTDNDYSFAGYRYGNSVYFGDEHYENLLVPRSLKWVRVTERLTDIAAGAFYKIYGLENVIFDYPDSIRTVGESAFEGCMHLGYDSDLSVAYKFDWLKNVRTIGNSAFSAYTGNYNSPVKKLFLYDDEDPNYVAELIEYPYPFTSMTSIPALTAAETIGDYAFYYQAALDSIEFGENLRTVGDSAFMYCLSAPSLHFPSTLQSIGVQAFMANMSVVEISFEAGKTGIDIGTYAFAFCSSLAQVVFDGSEPPQTGLNVFNNDMESSGSGYNNLFTDFRIFVPAGAEESFRTQMTAYAKYVTSAGSKLKPAYWRDSNGNIDVKFEFTDGSMVYVTDPSQNFIDSIDYLNFGEPTYGATCGTYYPLLYEVIDSETYARLAMEGNGGKHAKPLYANQKLIRLWHPELVAYDGTMIDDLYFFITEEKYEENGESYLLLVLRKTSYGSTRGDTTRVNDYVFLSNRFGVLQIGTVTMNGGIYGVKPIEEPEGTYFSLYESTGSVYSEGTVFYTFTYYNNKYEVIRSDVYAVEQTYTSSRVRKIPEGSNYYMLDIGYSYNEGNSLLLDGMGGARVVYDNTTYNLYVGENTQKAIGENGYTLSLYDDKACTELHFTVTFDDWYKGSYLVATLKCDEFTYDYYNVYADGDWYYPRDYDHITNTRFMYPQDSGSLYDDEWRYTRWTEQTIDATIKIYAVSTDGYETFEHAYFREYNGAATTTETRTAFGRVEKTGDGTLKFIYANGTEKTGNIVDKRGSFTIGETKYTYFDDSDDTTLVFTEDYYGTNLYYYTVKLDSYGNMYYLDEHDDGFYEIYVGTFDSYANFGSYYEIEFHGKKIDANGNPIAGAPDITLWILYDFNTLAAWSDDYEADAQWYGTITSINESRDDTVITVYDDFGYKIYDITADVYGNTSFVRYEYTINRRGGITYTAVEDERVSEFVAVYGGTEIAYLIALDANGRAIFSVRPSVYNSETFTITLDSGLTLPVTTSQEQVTVDVSELDKIQ